MSKRYVALSLLALASITALLLVAQGGTEDRRVSKAGLATDSAGLPQVLANSYRVLTAPADRLPPQIRARARLASGNSSDVMDQNGYRVSTPLGAGWVGVTEDPNRSTVCLILEASGALSCAPTTLAARSGLSVGTSNGKEKGNRGGLFAVVGLVPNWVQRIRVKVLGVGPRLLPVHANAYGASAATPILVEGYCGSAGTKCRPPLNAERRR